MVALLGKGEKGWTERSDPGDLMKFQMTFHIEHNPWINGLVHPPQRVPAPLSVAYMIGRGVWVHIADQTQWALCRLVARLA